MHGLTLLLTALLSASLSTAWAQQQAAYFLRHPAGGPAYARPLLPVGAGLPATAPLPAAWSVAAVVPLPVASRPGQFLLADALPPSPRPDATGVRPLYDLYRDLPEDFRKHTLPAVYTEPLPVQLLRGVLGR